MVDIWHAVGVPKILLSPHNDDAVLFASFTLLKHKPLVVTVFDSFIQPARMKARGGEPKQWLDCNAVARRREDGRAFDLLGVQYGFCGLHDDAITDMSRILRRIADVAIIGDLVSVELWAPLFEEGGHAQHNAVALAAQHFAEAGATVHRYTTYTRSGGRTRGVEVIPEPAWVLQKLHAMACYSSQITIGELGCWPWFMDLKEYTPSVDIMEAGK